MQVPVWFCVACPIVLGLLAPFVFNLGLTAAAEAVCQHYSLPDDQCSELWCALLETSALSDFTVEYSQGVLDTVTPVSYLGCRGP